MHVILLYSLDSHLLTGELVDSKCDFAEGSLANQFDKLVKVEGGWRQLVVLLDILFDVLNELVPLLENRIINLGSWFVAIAGGSTAVGFTRILSGACLSTIVGVYGVDASSTVGIIRLLVRISGMDDFAASTFVMTSIV